MKSHGHDLMKYIDDVTGFGTKSTAETSFKLLKNTLKSIGFDISTKKNGTTMYKGHRFRCRGRH